MNMKTIIHKLLMIMAMLWLSISASAYDFEVDGFYYNVISLEDMTCEVTEGDNKYDGDIVIPSTVEYNTRKFTVIQIGSEAFYQCTGLTSVEFPSSLTSIGAYAFSGCSSLTSVEFPSSLTSMGDYAFYGCSSLTSVEFLEGLTMIGEYAFRGCSGLKTVKFKDRLPQIYLAE